MEAYGDEAGVAECVRGGTSAVAASKITGDPLKTQNQDDIAVAAETSAIASIAIVTSIAEAVAIPIAIAVTILRRAILLLGSGQRSHRNHQQNCQEGKDASGSILP